MEFRIPYCNATSAEGAYTRVAQAFDGGYLDQFPFKIDFSCNDEKKEIVGLGRGAQLRLLFEEKDCLVSLELPLVLRPFNGAVITFVKKALGENI